MRSRRDENSIRVNNLSEDTTERDLPPSPPAPAKSLYGHLLVQWSPFFPQMRHTSRDALEPTRPSIPSAGLASILPEASSSFVARLTDSSTMLSVLTMEIMSSSRTPTAPPKSFQSRRASTLAETRFCCIERLIFRTLFTRSPFSFRRHS